MIRCLCCNKEISDPDEYEAKSLWHRKCIRSFFGKKVLPEIDISEPEIEKLANTAVSKGLTVPGVQKKLSLHLDGEDGEFRLTIKDYPTGYILKPQSEEYTALPEAEFLTMKLAELAGIRTVPNALLLLNGRYVYITKRVDRKENLVYAMEDFCQLSERITADKYKGSYENAGKIIKKFSKNTGLDLAEYFYRLLFCFLTGNSDMHLKNFSLREEEPASRIFHLSEAYDMLPVNIVMPADTEQMALTLNGKKKNIRKKDFMSLSESLGIQEKAALRMMDRILKLTDEFIRQTQSSYLTEIMKKDMTDLIRSRARDLGS